MSGDECFNGADLVPVALAELPEFRVGDPSSFGRRGAAWVTRFGITVAYRAAEVKGRGWWQGLGKWQMPRGYPPSPLWLEVAMEVCSAAVVEPPPRAFVCDTLDSTLVRWEVERRFSFLREAKILPRHLASVLGEHFEVEDPDAD